MNNEVPSIHAKRIAKAVLVLPRRRRQVAMWQAVANNPKHFSHKLAPRWFPYSQRLLDKALRELADAERAFIQDVLKRAMKL